MKKTVNNQSWQQEIFSNKNLEGKIVAIYQNKIIAVAESYIKLLRKVKDVKHVQLFSVPYNINDIRILLFKIRSLKQHNWLPVYPVKFFSDNHKIYTEHLLVDSGADISVIKHDFGKMLGFKVRPHEIEYYANGIGGLVPYYLREIQIEIIGHQFTAPCAWLSNPKIPEMILGREKVFDLFDIEFKQKSEKIIFRKNA